MGACRSPDVAVAPSVAPANALASQTVSIGGQGVGDARDRADIK